MAADVDGQARRGAPREVAVCSQPSTLEPQAVHEGAAGDRSGPLRYPEVPLEVGLCGRAAHDLRIGVAAKPARPVSTSRPIGILPPVLQSRTACGCLFGRTILRMLASAILLSSFNNLFAAFTLRFLRLFGAPGSRASPDPGRP